MWPLTVRDLKVQFDKAGAVTTDASNSIVGRGIRHNNLYELTAFIVEADVGTSKLWHERFGHLSYVMLKEMQKSGIVAHLPSFSSVSQMYVKLV
ncbi:hypothetical protein HX035_24475 [Escherichia coli]|nr:hypothetical protein [Escherichia coli]